MRGRRFRYATASPSITSTIGIIVTFVVMGVIMNLKPADAQPLTVNASTASGYTQK